MTCSQSCADAAGAKPLQSTVGPGRLPAAARPGPGRPLRPPTRTDSLGAYAPGRRARGPASRRPGAVAIAISTGAAVTVTAITVIKLEKPPSPPPSHTSRPLAS